jgi:hypothetical protein
MDTRPSVPKVKNTISQNQKNKQREFLTMQLLIEFEFNYTKSIVNETNMNQQNKT